MKLSTKKPKELLQMLQMQRNKKVTTRTASKFYTPVWCEDLTSPFRKPGEFVEHAGYKQLYKDSQSGILLGVIYRREGSAYFAVTSSQIIDHIEKEGLVPVLQNQYLRLFNTKRMLRRYTARLDSSVFI